jgi:hypothetical protein
VAKDFTDVITGSCTGHENPDLWFPEPPKYRPSIENSVALAGQVNEAISICNRCPEMMRCYNEGMKPENISYGIWGGMTAGERLLSSGVEREELDTFTDEAKAIDMFNRISPWLEV